MSYDIYLDINTGSGNYATAKSWNLTYNYAPMFALYSRLSTNGLRTIADANAATAADIIDGMRLDMEQYPNKYKEKEPSNGWGSYDGLLEWCREFVHEARQHPFCRVSIS